MSKTGVIHFLRNIKEPHFDDLPLQAVSACGGLRKDVDDISNIPDRFTGDTEEVTCQRCRETEVFIYADDDLTGSNCAKEVEVVQLDVAGWTALYFNHACVYQNHSINWPHVMNELEGKTVASYKRISVREWFDETHPNRGRLPATLNAVPDNLLT